MFPSLIDIAYRAPGILIGLVFHEFAHALAAHYYGDQTAKQMGRLTLNPLAHLDPLGTLFLFVFRFGWAKPVPVNPYNYRGNRRIADTVVSIAGPITNLLLSFILAILLSFLLKINFPNSDIIVNMTLQAVYINIVLFIFNLIPVPPLDGSHILFNLLPPGRRDIYFNLQKYGYVILILLLFTGLAGAIIGPVIETILKIEMSIIGVNLS